MSVMFLYNCNYYFLYFLFMSEGEHGAEQGLESVFRQHCPHVDSKQNTAAIRVVPFTKSNILFKILKKDY